MQQLHGSSHPVLEPGNVVTAYSATDTRPREQVQCDERRHGNEGNFDIEAG
ncbi:MAG: hypothetical protein WD672_05225 [Woeseia sp.]